MGEGKQGEITVSLFFFSLQLSRTKGDTVSRAHSPPLLSLCLDSCTPPEEVVLIATSRSEGAATAAADLDLETPVLP